MFWIRPDLDHSLLTPGGAWRLDTALFDIDGVLIDVTRSYRRSVIAAADHLVRITNGLTAAPEPLLTAEDVARFKRAGGFNNDWDLTRLFAALWTARLREWKGQPEAEIPLAEWAARASAAARARRGGVAWMRTALPPSAIPAAEVARWAHDEYYWGAALAREHYGHEPTYAPEARGVVHDEEMLLGPEVLPALVGRGITRFGLITGRVGPEVAWALHQIAFGCGLVEGPPPGGVAWCESPFGRSPFGVVLSGDECQKPDPRGLARALRVLGARGALYVGDTADDLDFVLRYRDEIRPGDAALPPVLAVSVASGEDAATYRERGADFVVEAVGELPVALAEATRVG